LHPQEYDPAEFQHVACASQGVVAPSHSFTSVHACPFPVHPMSHAHEYDPGEFEHVACASQGAGVALHSFTSLHACPLPVQPLLHSQV